MTRLTPLGFTIRDIIPDGHCLYRAVADQLREVRVIHGGGGGGGGGDCSSSTGSTMMC